MGNVNDIISSGWWGRERTSLYYKCSNRMYVILCTAVFMFPLSALFFGLGFPACMLICIEILPKLFNSIILVELNYFLFCYLFMSSHLPF
jgi:hypothetical protein